MRFKPSKLNFYTLYKIPSCYISGVRVKSISENKVVVRVKHRWINQNPFKSMYWVTQGMASELATGLLIMQEIALSNKKISMLLIKQSGSFVKKAKGTILFPCTDDKGLIREAIKKTVSTGEGQTLLLNSKGVDESGDTVSMFNYEWSLKVKKDN